MTSPSDYLATARAALARDDRATARQLVNEVRRSGVELDEEEASEVRDLLFDLSFEVKGVLQCQTWI